VQVIRNFLIICLLFHATPLMAADELLDAGRSATIDFMLERAVSQGFIGGGVVLVGNRSGVTYTAARGKIGFAADAPPLTDRTLFDIASLTKVVATAPAIMKLLEEGRITLLDPLSRWFPEFEGTGREDIPSSICLPTLRDSTMLPSARSIRSRRPSTRWPFKTAAGFPEAVSAMPISTSYCYPS